ncbi:MAG: hypothetical protein QM820_56575 [Minicystis sp.]
MRLSILLSGFTLGAVVALSAGTAQAAKHGHRPHPDDGPDSDYPLPYAQRPLTLPRMTISPELDFTATRVGGAAPAGALVPVGINIGASFGITKDIEVGALFLPIQFAPTAGYGSSAGANGSLQFFGTYRFIHHRDVEMGARLRTFIVTQGVTGAVIEPSVPVLLHLGRAARLDVELGVPITIAGVNGVTGAGAAKASRSYVGIDLPISLSFNVIQPLYLGVKTGLNIYDLGHPKEFASIPLGFFLGYSVGRDKPILDIVPFFTWSQFLTPGGGLGNEKFNAGYFTAGLIAKGFIYL